MYVGSYKDIILMMSPINLKSKDMYMLSQLEKVTDNQLAKQ